MSWFSGIEPREEWQVAYDPEDPARFVLEAQIDQGWTRFLMPVLGLLLISGLFGVVLIVTARRQTAELARAQDLGTSPGVVVAPIVAVRQQGKGLFTTVLIPREVGKPKRRELHSRPDKSESLLVVGERFVVGIAASNDPDNPIFLHETGYPFVMDEDQLVRARRLADAHVDAMTAE